MAVTERDKMKLSREEIARRQGMEYALKIAKEKGIEGQVRIWNNADEPFQGLYQ